MGETPTSCGSPARTPACSRSTGRTRCTTRSRASESGVGARFVASLPEHDALVLEFIQGTVLSAEELRKGDRIGARRRRLSPAARLAPLQRRLRHVRDPARLSRGRPRARFPAARPLRRLRAAGAGDRAGDARPARADGAVQQRSARRELHRHRRSAAAHRLRVLGQQRGIVRARQRLERVEPLASRSSRSS